MLREVHLYGDLAKRFGRRFMLDVQTAAEAVRALCVQIPGFYGAMMGGEWRLYRSRGKRFSGGQPLELLESRLQLSDYGHLHLMPAAKGRGKGGGAAKIIIGVLLVAAAVVTAGAALAVEGATLGSVMGASVGTYVTSGVVASGMFSVSSVAMFGLAMIFGGISMLLAPHPKQQRSPDQSPSYLITGPTNTATQGVPVPLVFGQVRVGTIMAGSSLVTEEYHPGAVSTGALSKAGLLHLLVSSGS